MRVTPENTLLMVIDVQERLVGHMHAADHAVQRICTLISGMQVLAIDSIVTEQYPRGLGSTITAVAAAAAHIQRPFFEKIAFSCLDDQPIRARIQAANARNLVICGIETHVCVAQTALDALAAGLTPVVVADAVTSRAVIDHQLALQRLQSAGAVITSVEAILFELVRFAGTETFKAVSRLVK